MDNSALILKVLKNLVFMFLKIIIRPHCIKYGQSAVELDGFFKSFQETWNMEMIGKQGRSMYLNVVSPIPNLTCWIGCSDRMPHSE